MKADELKDGINRLAEKYQRTILAGICASCGEYRPLEYGLFCSDTCKKAFFEHDSPEGE